MKTYFYFSLLLLLHTTRAKAQTDAAITEKQIYTSDFNIDEIPRFITFYMPEGFNKAEVCPVIFVLHDSGQTAKSVIKKYGDAIHAKADASHTIIVYPDALKKRWNDHMTDDASKINDAGFISIMMDYFVQRYHADPSKIYVLGIGNGGAMANNLSFMSHNRVAAIASLYGYLNNKAIAGYDTAAAMPAFILNTATSKGDNLSLTATTQYWVKRNKTNGPATSTINSFCASDAVRSIYNGDKNLVVYKVANESAACTEAAIKPAIAFLLAQQKK